MNPETIIKLDRFKAREYQKPLIRELMVNKRKRALAIWPRRAGKDICGFNIVVHKALERVGTYYYIFPTYSQGRKILWDGITSDGQRIIDYFLPKELVKSCNQSEMKIRLVNESVIQVCGSTDYDRLVGTNAVGMIFSEFALQDPRAWQFLRPVLVANQGWALFISCVSPNTLVITENGLKRIKDISSSRETYSDLNKNIWGLSGFHNAEQYYYGGFQKTRRIILESGYTIECTPVHPLWNGEEWIQSQHLKLGDLLPVQYGQDVWGKGVDFSSFNPKKHGARIDYFDYFNLPDDFYYLLGLIHADGNYNRQTVCVTKKKDPEIIEFLSNIGFRTRPDGVHHELSSMNLCELLEFLGFKHGARNKTFPEKLLDCTKNQLRSFLQGLFDGDGCSASNVSKRGYVKLTSTNSDFLHTIQVILLNFGIVSSIRCELKPPTEKVKVSSMIYNLEIYGYFAWCFYENVGFRLQRKQKNKEFIPINIRSESGNIYPVDGKKITYFPKHTVTNPTRISRRLLIELNKIKPSDYFDELLREKFFYSPIKEIIDSESEVFDFVIPDTHSFFSNGFLSHNTPRGKNHLWEIYNIAQQSDDWFCNKLTVEDTQHVSLQEIEKERQEMSEDLIQQEWYTSFSAGVEGAYYAKYIDKMRLKNQIGQVPWEESCLVHTAWDIGMRDQTSIIFFQNIGQTVRIIDCYEKSDVGLEHYVSVLKNKPYTYGKHIGPHDLQVREWTGNGITRIEKARQLGIKFTIAPNISVIDGIEAVRTTFSRTWIDESNCSSLIKALENYRKEWDSKRHIYHDHPLHNKYSHFADCMRYLAVSLPKTRDGLSSEELDKRYTEVMLGPNQGLPAVFRDDLPDY